LRSGQFTRRDFGRLAGLTGLGAAAPAVLAGCATERVEAARAGAAATRLWRVSGAAGSGLTGFDSTMKNFMQARGISCGALAVVRKGRLVLAKGYTWSDNTSLSVQPTSLFRIASLSKPITATAVLRLVQDGRLKLTDRVTTLLGLTPPPGKTADPRLANVTVLRLLQHLGGWDSGVSGDPMFKDLTIAAQLGVPLPVGRPSIMKYATGRPLDHAPGSAYAYSNYGYLLLGRIIEKITGLSYATYVQQKVLTPLSITRPRLGKTLTKASVEVPYYSQYTGKTVFDASGKTVPGPYGAFNLENMDAHGGWLASAVDLTRFAKIYDATTSVLNGTSVARAFAQPETGIQSGGWYYGCGWQVRPVTGGRNTWHTGSLPGTSTLLVRRFDGLTWAALFDQRDDPSGLSYGDIDPLLHKAADAVTTWPTGDLSSRYF
jgi:CubicO group peptidase (beta-lactamase class C family)